MARWSVALLLLAVSAPAWSQTRSITVQGEALVQVPPNQVTVRFGVETRSEDLAQARRDNDRRVTAVLDALRSLGLEDESVQSDRQSVAPYYEPGPTRGEREVAGYLARRTLSATLSDLDALEPTIDAIVGVGIDRIDGTEFYTTELRAHRDQARGLALDAAREKAVAMAGRLGQTIGAPLEIHEGAARPSGVFGAASVQNVMVSPGEVSSAGPTMPGRIPVWATVTVTFALED